ncbi:MAG: hypothetical protein M5U12_36595 [Verrucomicrobia bacterium]|nr:hypothetical protein [Verrucomicrobiota bacterium]
MVRIGDRVIGDGEDREGDRGESESVLAIADEVGEGILAVVIVLRGIAHGLVRLELDPAVERATQVLDAEREAARVFVVGEDSDLDGGVFGGDDCIGAGEGGGSRCGPRR